MAARPGGAGRSGPGQFALLPVDDALQRAGGERHGVGGPCLGCGEPSTRRGCRRASAHAHLCLLGVGVGADLPLRRRLHPHHGRRTRRGGAGAALHRDHPALVAAQLPDDGRQRHHAWGRRHPHPHVEYVDHECVERGGQLCVDLRGGRATGTGDRRRGVGNVYGAYVGWVAGGGRTPAWTVTDPAGLARPFPVERTHRTAHSGAGSAHGD